MKNRIATIYTTAILAVLLILAGWSILTLRNNRLKNHEAALQKTNLISSKVRNAFDDTGSFSNKDFSKKIKEIFKYEPRLQLITIYSNSKGIEYYYNAGSQADLVGKPEEQLKPEYDYKSFSQFKTSSTLKLDDQTYFVDSIFTIFNEEDIFPTLINVLLIILILFIMTVIMIIVLPKLGKSSSEKEINEEDNYDSDYDQENSSEESEDTLTDDMFGNDDDDTLFESEDDLNLDENSDSDSLFSDSADEDFSFDDELSIDDDLSFDDDSTEEQTSPEEFSLDDDLSVLDKELSMDDEEIEEAIPAEEGSSDSITDDEEDMDDDEFNLDFDLDGDDSNMDLSSLDDEAFDSDDDFSFGEPEEELPEPAALDSDLGIDKTKEVSEEMDLDMDFGLDESDDEISEGSEELSEDVDLDMDFELDEPEENISEEMDLDTDFSLDEPEVDISDTDEEGSDELSEDIDLDMDFGLDEPEENISEEMDLDTDFSLDEPEESDDFSIPEEESNEEDNITLDDILDAEENTGEESENEEDDILSLDENSAIDSFDGEEEEDSPFPDQGESLSEEELDNTISGLFYQEDDEQSETPPAAVRLKPQEMANEKLEEELESAAVTDNEIVLALIKSNNLDNQTYEMMIESIKSQLLENDDVFEYSDNIFSLIWKDSQLKDVMIKINKFLKEHESEASPLSFSIGLSARYGRNVSTARLKREAELALSKSEETGVDKNITAFKPDLKKYKEYIKSHR